MAFEDVQVWRKDAGVVLTHKDILLRLANCAILVGGSTKGIFESWFDVGKHFFDFFVF